MCGGKGTRLDADVEKPLFEVGGTPLVETVLDALAASRVDTAYAVVSPHAPETAAHVDVPTIETPGEGYVEDLDAALADDRVSTPVLTVAADLPLLDGAVVDDVLDAHETGSLSVVVPAALKRELGVSCDTAFEHEGRDLAPTGVNVVADAADDLLVSYDVRLAVNCNRRTDAAVAERLRR
ncbi:NTP transferase domain-containing protein [Haloarculaceae archaeon H-GB2-1]|nr:NTP transferase domain-containing protein [Haloarculaceae archaeon H-GB1-1]MEA5388163.1 NTP transferase domain-containing protein [Haloarculaceae archaeon H-GB11]MEA5406183.1 NTP transferase domain-containing protein [Haloarculaceae archaeon H-GB2-1]